MQVAFDNTQLVSIMSTRPRLDIMVTFLKKWPFGRHYCITNISCFTILFQKVSCVDLLLCQCCAGEGEESCCLKVFCPYKISQYSFMFCFTNVWYCHSCSCHVSIFSYSYFFVTAKNDKSLTLYTQFQLLTTFRIKSFDNMMGKGENAGNQHFLLFPP